MIRGERSSLRLILAIAALTAPGLVARGAGPAPSAASKQEYGPDPASVVRFGPAYRYPQSGWIVLHIEGSPYDRGYQHGRLLAPEIADYVRTLAVKRSPKAPAAAWDSARTLVNALFLRRYDKEYLEEMKGTADGAAASGATFEGRLIDLLDIVAINSEIEADYLDHALHSTAEGLEGRTFRDPAAPRPRAEAPDHCSAFAAVGPATADGQVVFGHITMWNLFRRPGTSISGSTSSPPRGHRVRHADLPRRDSFRDGLLHERSPASSSPRPPSPRPTVQARRHARGRAYPARAIQYSETRSTTSVAITGDATTTGSTRTSG